MNVSLLIKWKWRILLEEKANWYQLLHHRYTNPEVKMFIDNNDVMSKRDSIWWRDLILINDYKGLMGLSVLDMFHCRVKFGERTPFWFSRWMGNQAI